MDCSTLNSFDEQGDLRCSDLDLPLFTSESLMRVFVFHFWSMKKTQWESMKNGIVDDDTFDWLFHLCEALVETVRADIVEAVAPHIRTPAGDCSANKSVTMNEIGSRNYHTVTEEDVEASLGNSLHQCLGEVVGVVEESSKYSEELLQLVAEDVAKRVNCTLAFTGQTAPFQGSMNLTLDMVVRVAKILTRCLRKKDKLQFLLKKLDNAFSRKYLDGRSTEPFSTPEPDNETMFEEFGTEQPANKPKVEKFNTEEFDNAFSTQYLESRSAVEFSSPELDNKTIFVEELGTEQQANEPKVEELNMEQLMFDWFSNQGFDGESTVEFGTEEPDNKLMVEEFGTEEPTNEPKVEVFNTEKPDNDLVIEDFSSLDFDVESMVEFSTEEPDIKTIVEELSSKGSKNSSLPSTQTQEFGSAKLEETVRKSPSFVKKVRTFFRRKSKIAPVCEVALLEKKQKCSAGIGMFGAVARILRKPFTCCISCGS